MFLRFMEFVLLALVLLTFSTQVLIPAWNGRKLFPILRKQGKLERKLVDIRQRDVEERLEAEIAEGQQHQIGHNVESADQE